MHTGNHTSSGGMSSGLVQQSQLPLPSKLHPCRLDVWLNETKYRPALANTVPPSSGGGSAYPSPQFDTTGQVAPHGMKPRVTATLWEDEGSLCFQVEAAGVCVARREDNHMINGTKLLNVAGMTRGRRDGILKSEKTRHVVKIGPMHLKGVWIPFDRALDFANKEKITESLYPLFVHNIGALLYHPQNNARQSVSGATAIAAAERRRPDGYPGHMRTPSITQPPSLGQHHSMANPIGAHVAQPPHSIAPHPSSGRPGLDRAHTFPTPPTSASSMMGMGNSGSSYEWSAAPVQQSHPLTVDTNLSNAKSVPTTPATTPPGSSMQSMSAYQTTQPYDNSRQMYSTASQHAPYTAQQGMSRYGQLEPSPYIKNEMAPPARTGAAPETNGDQKTQDAYAHHPQAGHHAEDGDGEHEADYTHSAGPYGSRSSYAYGAGATASSLHGDQSHISPHDKPSGGATPRTTNSYAGYSTPQRSQQLPSSNLYNVMSDNRNGSNGADMYSAHNSYPSQQYGAPNGLPPSNKRVREVDDADDHYSHSDSMEGGLKRARTVREDSVGRPRPVAAHKKR